MTATREKEVIKSIPDGWRRVQLGDVAEVVGGSTPSRTEGRYWEGDVPWVVPSELTALKGRYLSATKEFITDEGMRSASLRLIPAGSILLTSRATVGVTAINGVPIVTNQGFQNLIVKNGADPLWLYYCVSQQRPELERKASGSTFLEVSRDSVRSLPILLPPLREQRAIAAVLDSIDDAIEGAEAVITATEGLREALLHDLLTNGLPGHHTEFRDVPGLGTIPADWEVVRLGDVYEVQLGKMLSPKARQGVNPKPYLTNRNVRWGGFELSDLPTMDFDQREMEKFRLRSGDLMVCEGGETGRAAVWKGELSECYYQKALHRLRPRKEGAISSFLLAVLIHYGRKGILLDHSEQTSIPHLTRERLLRMPIPNPSIEEQIEISGTLKVADESVGVAMEEAAGLRLMKESTADALLTGRVQVPDCRV